MSRSGEKKEPWRRHYLIRRRADWVRDVMASDLGGPAKVAAYALALSFSHKTMRAQVDQETLAKDAGMSVRQLRDALAVLENEGWLTRTEGGRRPNTYRAVECQVDCEEENRLTKARLFGGKGSLYSAEKGHAE